LVISSGIITLHVGYHSVEDELAYSLAWSVNLYEFKIYGLLQ